MARNTFVAASSWAGCASGRAVSVGEEASETGPGPSWSSESWASWGASASSAASAGYGASGAGGGVLGKYRLIERVGRGRQADVWRAARGGSDPGEVALKVLPASARDPRRRAQLRHEAERGRRLVGPSLLPAYDFGEAAGASFMAMPLVVGCTLADILNQRRARREGRLPREAHRLAFAPDRSYARDVVALLARVARAASHAHAARVVHRDIKPGNILVRRDHAEGVFLCDFGLARDLDVATPRQLRDGAGSPLYMAPERLLKLPADEVRADVYALGVTLFEALTLSPPVEIPEGLPRPLWIAYLADASVRRPSKLWPAIPDALEAAILRATDRDPSRRHPGADVFAGDLERFLGGEPAGRPGPATGVVAVDRWRMTGG